MKRVEFVAVVRALHDDLLAPPDEWENTTLDRFLDALAAWVEDSGGKLHEGDDWSAFADALRAARFYE